jgi:hypothetical protein
LSKIHGAESSFKVLVRRGCRFAGEEVQYSVYEVNIMNCQPNTLSRIHTGRLPPANRLAG